MEDYNASHHDNPLTPDSIPALLAEEWCIQPTSPLPSFLEMMMIEDADRTISRALRTCIRSICDQLRNLVQNHQQSSSLGFNATYNDNARRIGPIDSTLGEGTFHTYLHKQRVLLEKLFIRFVDMLEKVIRKYSSEWQCLLRYCIERQCLQTRNSTISETVYGTIRVHSKFTSDGKTQQLSPLSLIDQTRVAILVAFRPYIHEKLQNMYRNWNNNYNSNRSTTSSSRLDNNGMLLKFFYMKLQQYFFNIYPYISCSIQLSNLYCQWKFLMGMSNFTDLPNTLLSQIVRRVTQQDQQKVENNKNESNSKTTTTTTAMDSGMDRYKSPVLYMLAASITFSWLTQLRAWYQERHQQLELIRQQQEDGGLTSSSSLIPPPPVPKRIDGCPLCGRKQRIHPTACTKTGYVFCLGCIRPFVREHGRCPVTALELTDTHLVRLFEPTDTI